MRSKLLLAVPAACIVAGGGYGVIKWRSHLKQEAVQEALLTEVIRQIASQCIPQAKRNPMVRDDGGAVISERYCACAAEPPARMIVENMLAARAAGTGMPESMQAYGALPDRAADVSPEVWECHDRISPEEMARRLSAPLARGF